MGTLAHVRLGCCWAQNLCLEAVIRASDTPCSAAPFPGTLKTAESDGEAAAVPGAEAPAALEAVHARASQVRGRVAAAGGGAAAGRTMCFCNLHTLVHDVQLQQ